MEFIEVNNLTKIYGEGENKVEALCDVNLNICKGEFVSIMGASGSGKSTLLHLLGGLDKPTSGKVIIDNTDIYSLSQDEITVFRRKSVGFIFQFFNLLPVLTVEENILLPILLDKVRYNQSFIDELIDFLGLGPRKKHLPSALSGGQQQRAAIARALSTKPAIILADEPTGNLDSKTGKDVLDLLRLTSKRYNQTLVIVTHDLNVAKAADRLIVVSDGSITEERKVNHERSNTIIV